MKELPHTTQSLVTKRKKINEQSSENRKSVGHSYSIFYALLQNLVDNQLLTLLKVCFIWISTKADQDW